MIRTIHHVICSLAVIALLAITGCQTASALDPSRGRITTEAYTGKHWLAFVIRITDENGTEVYSVFKRSLLQFSTDLPPGVYTITHTCSPSSDPRYEIHPGQWQYPRWSTKLRLNAGDHIKLVAEGGLTLRGVLCEGKFFVPSGQLVQANRLVD